jgi:hypothetical protein
MRDGPRAPVDDEFVLLWLVRDGSYAEELKGLGVLDAPYSRCRERAWKSQMMFLRTSGSPPVMRIF